MDLREPCLPRIDYFVPNLAEAQALTGLDESEDVARALLDCGVGAVGLKMGAAECLVMANTGELLCVPAFEVNVIDATGEAMPLPRAFAGVWQNWPLEQTACLANAIGALCVTGVGATGGMHSLPGALVFNELIEGRDYEELDWLILSHPMGR